MVQAICRCILVVSLWLGGWANTSNAQSPKELTNSIGMKLVLIPKGTITMGSPESEQGRQKDEVHHEVTISKDYYLGVYEVTQAQYEKVMGGQRLLWNHGSRSSIAVARIGPIKEHPQRTLAIFLGLATVIKTSSPCRENVLVFQLLTTHRRIEFAGKLQDGISEDFVLHPSCVHPPVPTILGVFLMRWISAYRR